MATGEPVEFDPRDPWDVLHDRSAPDLHWSTSNIGEALPGVPTPLSWSMWDVLEAGTRGGAYSVGALTRRERPAPPSVEDRFIRIFYGRPAIQVEYLVLLGDRLPGTSGEASARGIFGRVPEDIDYHPTIRRYPIVAWRLPTTFMAVPRRVRRATRFTDRWYTEQISRVPGQDMSAAIASFLGAQRHFERMITLQGQVLFGAVQLLYDVLGRLIAQTGIGDLAVLSGSGGVEMVGVVGDIWAASRGQLGVEDVARRHGFHGPKEGELSGRVWREDLTPLRRLVEEYAARPDSEDPLARERERQAEREQMMADLLQAVPRSKRPNTKLLLKLAGNRIPLRGAAKRLFLEAFDVARASSRRIGELLAADGVIDHPDDVFYLTAGEIIRTVPGNAKELVEMRRERGRVYEELTVPNHWKGMPVPDRISDMVAREKDQPALEGIGVSPGKVEGVARVVMDPGTDEVAPGEVLIAPFTDPSWSSIMFLASALVVDIGGPLSHAAVVARELGMPCVVNTGLGSRIIRSGDRVRVDGSSGTVEILGAGAASAAGGQ